MGQPSKSASSPKRPKAMDPDARQDQLISLAVDLAEEQLRNGTASSQVITHYLKLGSSKERLEQEMLKKQMELVSAKTDALQSAKRIEELYSKAIQAMLVYGGHADEEDSNI